MQGFKRTFTDTEVFETIDAAINVVAKLDPPEDLRAAAFAAALNLVGNMSVDRNAVAVPNMVTPEKLL